MRIPIEDYDDDVKISALSVKDRKKNHLFAGSRKSNEKTQSKLGAMKIGFMK